MLGRTVPFLSAADAAMKLEQGATLQQWLGVSESNGFRFIHWLQVEACQPGWSVWKKVSLDAGDACNRDMTSFIDVGDPDAPEGVRWNGTTVEEVLDYCTRIGGARDRFVAFSLIQFMYDAYVREHGHARPAAEYFQPG